MRSPTFLSVLLGASAASANGFATPEDAVRGLEAAYARKDLDAAARAKDFEEEARLMLQKLDPQLAADAGILAKTAEVLELAFRKELREQGFPDFSRVTCTFVAKQSLSPTLTRLTEECVSPTGQKTSQDLYASRASGSWRVVLVPP